MGTALTKRNPGSHRQIEAKAIKKLRHIFAAGEEPSATKLPKKTTLEERIQKARELHQSGLSLGQIAKVLGISKPTVKNYLEDYPYRR